MRNAISYTLVMLTRPRGWGEGHSKSRLRIFYFSLKT